MGGLSGVIGGLIGGAQDLPTMDVSALMNTIKNAGVYQKDIINALPADVQKLIATYQANGTNAANALQTGMTGVDNNLTSKIAGLYGPNSDAANAQKVADKQAIYSTVPGTQDAIRNAMAATGGLSRGNAGVALAQPYVTAASQNAQAAAGVNAKQTAAGQDAMQAALNRVASMDASTFQSIFGMSQQQANQILQSGNQALSTQLQDLINQSTTETNQMLGVEGIQAQTGYNNAVTRNAQQGQVWNGLANMGLQGINMGLQAFLGPGAGGMSGLPGGADVGSSSYMANAGNSSPVW